MARPVACRTVKLDHLYAQVGVFDEHASVALLLNTHQAVTHRMTSATNPEVGTGRRDRARVMR